jgi:hypothetical protein
MKFRSVLNLENLGERIVPDATLACDHTDHSGFASNYSSTTSATVPNPTGGPSSPPVGPIQIPPFDPNNASCFTVWLEYKRQVLIASQHVQTVWEIDEELRPLMQEWKVLTRELEREMIKQTPDLVRIAGLETAIESNRTRVLELLVARMEAIKAHQDAIDNAKLYWFILSVAPNCGHAYFPIPENPPSYYEFESLPF